ncbi:MAG: hypothetical protein IKU25_04865 [Clostridia bacterium]|nr:hypothetical protein [Clostridia bacterium]
MNTSKRDKIILSVLLIVIIGVVMYYVSINPSIKEAKRLDTKIADARASIESLSGKSTLINELKKKVEEVEAEVKVEEGDMPAFDDYAAYLADFQDITEGRAIRTKILFKDKAPSSSGVYTVVKAGIEFECKYDDLKFIMDALLEEKVHCYDIEINTLRSSTSEDTEDDVADIKVKFVADYFSKSEQYQYTEYDFSSGRYGLTDLFDGVVVGIPYEN